MSADDCIKIIAAVSASMVGVLAAVVKMNSDIAANRRRLDALHEKVDLLG